MKRECLSVSPIKTKKTKASVAIAFGLALMAATGTASAKDSLVVNVTAAPVSPVIVNNGQANGTIQLFYTVNANQFTPGEFATFDVNWITSAGSGPATDYGAGLKFSLSQDQQGGFLDLLASPATFSLTATGQSGTSHVTVFIAPDKAGNLPPSADGTDLVGNLKLDAGSKVASVTNIQVHIRLVRPALECLKVYNFITDQDFNLGILDTTTLNVPTSGKKAGKVVSSQPGQFSDNVLIANTCVMDQSFDLKISLDDSFTTNPSGNPGNAVFTYASGGEFDSSDFSELLAGEGTPNHENLCLQKVTVPAGSSFLATVHSGIKDSWPKTSLPADDSFDFAATLYHGVNLGCTGAPEMLAAPNPAKFVLPFTLK